jgi:hypothetical protein
MFKENWMRLFKISVLASAVVLFAAAQASAMTITLGGTGGEVNVSDDIVLTANIENRDDDGFGLAVFAFTIFFDDSLVSLGLSKHVTTILRNPQNDNSYPTANPGKFLTANAIFTGVAGEITYDWNNGTDGTWNTTNDLKVVTQTFHADAGGTASFSVGAGTGSFMAQFEGTYASPDSVASNNTNLMKFAGAGNVTIVPEPTTALLIGLGLIGLGVAGSRGRQER